MSIALLVQECLTQLKKFQQHSEQYEQGQDDHSIEDELGRFKIWCGNLSAHRPFGGRSLEHRLRDSPNLRDEVLKLLGDLRNALQQLENPVAESEDASLQSDDESLDFEFDDLAIQPVHPLQNIHDVINVLYRFSITLRNPAGHRRILEGASSISSAFLPYDLERVSMKYPKAESHLTERLGRAMAMRRQYFKYRQDHHTKMADGLEPEVVNEQQSNKDHLSTIATSVRPTATAQVIEYADETESVYSVTSFAPTESETGKLRPPPLPFEAINGDPFQCPICYSIQSISTDEAWRRHVFEDVQPYSCTVSDCSTRHALYSRRRDWQRHQVKMHNNIWICPLGCAVSHSSRSALEQHLVDEHGHSRDDPALPNILEASAKPNQQKHNLECPLCQKADLGVNAWFKHVGKHMEQLALSSLPSSVLAEDSDSDDEADNPQQLRSSASGESQPAAVETVDAGDPANNDYAIDYIPAVWESALAVEVKDRGGYDKVNEGGLWASVANNIGDPRPGRLPAAGLADFVKDHYEKFLDSEGEQDSREPERQPRQQHQQDDNNEGSDPDTLASSEGGEANRGPTQEIIPGERNHFVDGEPADIEATDPLNPSQYPAPSHHDEESDLANPIRQQGGGGVYTDVSATDQTVQDGTGLKTEPMPVNEAERFTVESNTTVAPSGLPSEGNNVPRVHLGSDVEATVATSDAVDFDSNAAINKRHHCIEPNCGRSFSRLVDLRRHHQEYHGYGLRSVFKCDAPSCYYTSRRSDQVKEHCQRIHYQHRGNEKFSTILVPQDVPEVPSARLLNTSQGPSTPASATTVATSATRIASDDEMDDSEGARFDQWANSFAHWAHNAPTSAAIASSDSAATASDSASIASDPEYDDETVESRVRLGDKSVENLEKMALHERSDAPAHDPRTVQLHQATLAERELAQERAQFDEDVRQHEWERDVESWKAQVKLQAIEEQLKRERDTEGDNGLGDKDERDSSTTISGRSQDPPEQTPPEGTSPETLLSGTTQSDPSGRGTREGISLPKYMGRPIQEAMEARERQETETQRLRGRTLASPTDAERVRQRARPRRPENLPSADPLGFLDAVGSGAEVRARRDGGTLDTLQDRQLRDREEQRRKELEREVEVLIAEREALQRARFAADEVGATKTKRAETARRAEEGSVKPLRVSGGEVDAASHHRDERPDVPWSEWVSKEIEDRKRKETAKKEEAEKEEAEKKFQAEMRKRLASMGYTEQTIDILVDEEKAKKFREDVARQNTTTTTDNAETRRSRAPVYPKIHRDYLDIETLKYYELPWEYDRKNPDYIIILRDMDKRETDILFEHTRRLRAGTLLQVGSKGSATRKARTAEESYATLLEKEEKARQAYEQAQKELSEEIQRGRHMPKVGIQPDLGSQEHLQSPIRFTDALGHKYSFPWRLCKTWQGMETLINEVFKYVDSMNEDVQQGRYHLFGPNGEIILPQVWESNVSPGSAITMRMSTQNDRGSISSTGNPSSSPGPDAPSTLIESGSSNRVRTIAARSGRQPKSKESKEPSSLSRWLTGQRKKQRDRSV